jgi:hypothetical protein
MERSISPWLTRSRGRHGLLHHGEQTTSSDGCRQSLSRSRWQRGGSGRYAINGGSGRAVGPALVSAILRFEATSIPCGSDEGPALQCEG